MAVEGIGTFEAQPLRRSWAKRDEVQGAALGEWGWHAVDLADTLALERIRPAIAKICRQDPRATLEHDLDWALGNAADDSDVELKLWLCHGGEGIVGYAPLIARPARLRPSIGERTVASWQIQRLTLVGCPLFSAAVRDRERSFTLGLLAAIRRDLPARAAIFVLGGRADSALFKLLTERAKSQPFLVAGYGSPYQRRLIELPDSFDDYLASLGKSTRRDLRRCEKRPQKTAGTTLRIARYTASDDVEPFLDTAVALSKKTYQWKDLGLGLRDRTSLARQLRVAAEHGWMLCYILFRNEEAIAYQLGYSYGDCYFTHDTGFDPDWADLRPGTSMDLTILRDQIERYPDIRWGDFLYGDSFKKQRLSNSARLERNFYLLPRTPWGLGVYASLRSASFVSEEAGKFLDRLGLKETLRRALWRS